MHMLKRLWIIILSIYNCFLNKFKKEKNIIDDSNITILVDKQLQNNYNTNLYKCKKCKCGEISVDMRQQRLSYEPCTYIFTCRTCCHVWRK